MAPIRSALGLAAAGLVLLAGLPLGAQAPPAFPTGRIVERVECQATPGQSYALYLPASYSPQRRWPILYLFDPRENGPRAAELFRDGAERYGYLIASSNNSRSDGPAQVNVDAMKAMWQDTLERFALDERRLYAGGFSGGARAACTMGRGLPGSVAGVIGCGGGFPEGWPPSKEVRFAFHGLAGNRDFNYAELTELDRTLEKLGVPHRLAIFDGGHQWPPAEECTGALEWMELRAMRDGLRPRDPQLLERLYEAGLKRALAQEAAGSRVEAERRASALAADFQDLLDTSAARRKAEEIRASEDYEKTLRLRERLEKRDRQLIDKARQVLETALSPSAEAPLPRIVAELEIDRLKKEVRKHGRSEEGLAAERVLQTILGQVGFYMPRLLIEHKEHARAALSYQVALAIEPDNPRLWYNLACARALAGDPKSALEALEKAEDAGFEQADHLRRDPDLASLREHPRFQALLDRLAAKP